MTILIDKDPFSVNKLYSGEYLHVNDYYPFTVEVNYDDNSSSTNFTITWLDDKPKNLQEVEAKIIKEFDNVEDFTPHLITINKIELASNLAHKSVMDELIIPFQTDGSYSIYENEDDLFIEDENENMIYKDDVQDVFNRWYDFYLNMIEESGE